MLHKGSTILHSSNWDNLRFVLAVAEDGSVSAAARRLGVNHATVLRRVAAFEEEQGGPVFEKTATGYRVLPDRATVIDAARDVANSVLVVERLMHGARAPLRGVVRVASTDSLCQMVLPPLIAELNRLSPELRVDLMSSNGHLDFSRLQADITVRPAERLPEDMTGEICTRFAFHPYGAPGVEDRWLGLTGPLARSNPARWITANVAPEAIVAGADSFLVLREMARAGLKKVVDFQDTDYGAEYLGRLESLVSRDSAEKDYELSREAAKYIANAMAYDDVIRVADLKTRSQRFDRIETEMQVKDGKLMHLTDYLHPRAEEIVGLLPEKMGRKMENDPVWMNRIDRWFNRGRRIRTDSLRGFAMLYFLGGLRGWRRKTLRHRMEQDHLESWLKMVSGYLPDRYAMAVETLRCRRPVSYTHLTLPTILLV